jgi:hypothetical protein
MEMTKEVTVDVLGPQSTSTDLEDPPKCAFQEQPARATSTGVDSAPSCRQADACPLSQYARGRLCPKNADQATKLAVDVSVIFALSLQWGQIYENFVYPEVMEGLVWPFYASGATAYLIMASYYCSTGEIEICRVVIFSAWITLTPLIQMFAYREKPLVPFLPFVVLMATFTLGTIIITAWLCGTGERVFAWWMDVVTTIAGALLGYTVSHEILHDTGLLAGFPWTKLACDSAASAVGFAVLLCMVLNNRTTDQTGALLATILNLYMPLPEIWENFSQPAEAADFNMSYIYFIVLGSCLGLPRSLYIRDMIWLILEVWGLFVKGVLISISVLVANARLPTPFLTPLRRNLLIVFNIAAIFFASVLFAFLPKRKSIEESQNKEPTCEDIEHSV